MKEPHKEDKGNQKVTEIKTFQIPFASSEIKENIVRQKKSKNRKSINGEI